MHFRCNRKVFALWSAFLRVHRLGAKPIDSHVHLPGVLYLASGQTFSAKTLHVRGLASKWLHVLRVLIPALYVCPGESKLSSSTRTAEVKTATTRRDEAKDIQDVLRLLVLLLVLSFYSVQ